MPSWLDTLTLPDGSATPVNQTYNRVISPTGSFSWVNDTARALGNDETLVMRASEVTVKEGAVIVPMIQWNLKWTSKDSTDPSATVCNLTIRLPKVLSVGITTGRKKVKGFLTGIVSTLSDTDAERDLISGGRVY